MEKLLIIYDSRTGNTEEMANAVFEGAVSSGGATVIIKKVANASVDDLLRCDAVIFGTPTNFGYMSALMKGFFEQAFLTIGDKTANKPYSSFASSGSGTRAALDSIDFICNAFSQFKSFKFRKVFDGIIATLQPSPEILEECRELGGKMAQLQPSHVS